MGEVNHHADAVHFLHHFAAKLAQSAVLAVGFARRVADVVVAVVAESDVNHTFAAVSLNVGEVAADGIAVFNT